MVDVKKPSFPTATGDKLTATRIQLGQLRFARRAESISCRDGHGNAAFCGQRYDYVLQELCEVDGKNYWFDIPVEYEIYD